MGRVNLRVTYLPGAIIALIAALLLGAARPSTALLAQTSDAATLTIKVVGARNAKGNVGVALFQAADGFPEDSSKATHQQNAEIDHTTLSAEVVFQDVPRGVYALSVRHDENMNEKLDKNFLGIPKEGYGASNNPKKKRRAPTFDEARFSLDAPEQTVEIKLIY